MTLAVLVVLGLCFGSFINALVWRLHEQAEDKKDSKEYSVLKGRSMCPDCRHILAWHDLLPVISWLFLRGRCRYCGKPISWQYPVVELLTAGLFVFSYIYWPLGLDSRGAVLLISWLAALVGLIALAIYDIKWMFLPDRIIFPLIALTVFAVLADALLFGSGINAVQNAFLGLVFCGGLFYAIFQISDGRWIGGGDVKLGFLLGLIVGGPLRALLLIFVASVLGSLMSGALILSRRLNATSRIPFGPFLIVAAVIIQLFGAQLVDWYKSGFLLL